MCFLRRPHPPLHPSPTRRLGSCSSFLPPAKAHKRLQETSENSSHYHLSLLGVTCQTLSTKTWKWKRDTEKQEISWPGQRTERGPKQEWPGSRSVWSYLSGCQNQIKILAEQRNQLKLAPESKLDGKSQHSQRVKGLDFAVLQKAREEAVIKEWRGANEKSPHGNSKRWDFWK